MHAMSQMLQVQPHINAVNEHGNSPLHYACFFGYEGLCEVSIHVRHTRCNTVYVQIFEDVNFTNKCF